MRLYIDTADRENKVLRLDDVEKYFNGDTLEAIDGFLRESGIVLGDLTEIEVKRGPGGFSSLREGVVVANTLNYCLGLKKVSEMDMPEYGQEPNITVSPNFP